MTANISAPLYLSRLLLNRSSRQVQSEVAQPYEMHRTLMRAFPGNDNNGVGARCNFGILYRAETQIHGEQLRVYVQSSVEPDWSYLNLLDGYLDSYGSALPFEHKDIMPMLREISKNDCFTFRLRANPTKRVAKKDDPLKGKRVEITREDEQIAWLARKGKQSENNIMGGFELLVNDHIKGEYKDSSQLKVNVYTEGKHTNSKFISGVKHRLTHQAVVFEGLLRVTDVEAFSDTIRFGIGSAKSFGFGLLSIAPIQ